MVVRFSLKKNDFKKKIGIIRLNLVYFGYFEIWVDSIILGEVVRIFRKMVQT